MDSNSSGYFVSNANLPSKFCLENEDSSIIDLGLSLRVLQPDAFYSSTHENYDVLVDWQQLDPQPRKTKERYDEKQRWTYVKVNMDGVIVGRKICILDHIDYFSLTLRLEDMFGKQSMCGLRLFEEESEFSLNYEDRDERWRAVGDVPWKEFVDNVKRLRIARKDEFSPTSAHNRH